MKNVLITGGSRGIGKAMVELFSERGYNVAFTYKTSDAAAEELAHKTGALAIKADSEKSEDISRAVLTVEERLGEVDILVNNAAYSSFALLQDIDEAEWNKTFAVSVTAAFLYSKAVIPGMISRKFGRIINISSMWGSVGAACEVHYSAAKAALIGFTKALAKELGPSGITVNAVAPGLINTDMNSHLGEEAIADIASETPVCRVGEPREVAEAVLFLSGETAGFITGDIMNISGGFVV